MAIKPWGSIGWLLPKTNVKKWHVVLSSSFEERCAGLLRWINYGLIEHRSSTFINLTNPSSEFWTSAEPLVEKNRKILSTYQKNITSFNVDANLLSFPSTVVRASIINSENEESVILDITTMPKKFSLFAIQQLLRSPAVKNLMITYTKASDYPEAALCEDALPPTALQGFGRMKKSDNGSRLIVGVGYMPLNIEMLIEQAKNTKLDFIFPFPPGSPAFRRNWSLLSMLMPTEFPRTTEIHRIHSMDAFEVFERVKAWGGKQDLDLIPLGPKPHALGMMMAHHRLDGRAEIIYSQPQSYNPNYSKGIAVDENGQPQIVAYCLRLNGKDMF